MCKSSVCSHKSESRKMIQGFNDLATRFPQLGSELVGKDPKATHYGTNKKALWRCSTCGHEWYSTVANRTKLGNGCPGCSGRAVTSKNNLLNHKKIAKELHNFNPEKIASMSNKLVQWKCSKCKYIWEATPNNRVSKKSGCPACHGVFVLTDKKRLSVVNPEIARELIDKDPEKTHAGSGTRAKWKCLKCCHTWCATVYDRVSNGHGCPSCCGRVCSDKTSLLNRFPEIAKEIVGADPRKIHSGSRARHEWKCSKCKTKWFGSVNKRTLRGLQCPECRVYGYKTSEPGYFYLLSMGNCKKFGITNDPKRRVHQEHKKTGFSLVEMIGPLPGIIPQSVESSIKKAFISFGIPTGSKAFPAKFRGWAETWLVKDLNVNSISELASSLCVKLPEQMIK